MSGNILDALGGAGGIAQIAQELGIDQQTVATGAAALLPAVLGGFKKQAQAQPNGLDGLAGMLGGLGGGGLLDAVLAPQATPIDQGNAVLGPDLRLSRCQPAGGGAGQRVPRAFAELLKKLLPIVAMAAAGMMAKSASAGSAAAPAQGGLGGLLGQVLGGLGGGAAAPAATGGLGGLASMLDLNGDGNPLDDILGMAQRMTPLRLRAGYRARQAGKPPEKSAPA